MRQGFWAGIIAAAATLGVLVGFGWARGASLAPLNAIARGVFGMRAEVVHGFDPTVTVAALVLHVVALIIWATIFAVLAGRLRGSALVAAAIIYSGAVFLVDHFVIPTTFSPGFQGTLSPPELGVVYLVLALALAAGTQLAATPPDRA